MTIILLSLDRPSNSPRRSALHFFTSHLEFTTKGSKVGKFKSFETDQIQMYRILYGFLICFESCELPNFRAIHRKFSALLGETFEYLSNTKIICFMYLKIQQFDAYLKIRSQSILIILSIEFNSNVKKRGPDPSIRGRGTCTGINFDPIAKPFEMGAYLSVIKRPMFYLTIGCWKVKFLGIFKKSLTYVGILRSRNW